MTSLYSQIKFEQKLLLEHKHIHIETRMCNRLRFVFSLVLFLRFAGNFA